MSLVDQRRSHVSGVVNHRGIVLARDHRAARRLCHRTVRRVQRHRLAEFISRSCLLSRRVGNRCCGSHHEAEIRRRSLGFRRGSCGMRTGASTGRRPYWRDAEASGGKLSGLIEPPWALGAYHAAICAAAILDRDDLVSRDPPGCPHPRLRGTAVMGQSFAFVEGRSSGRWASTLGRVRLQDR